MPPKRCPECGRFLSNEFVASLATASAPCPRCDTPLVPEVIVGGGERGPRPIERATPEATDGSVRPPDLDPTDVRSQDPDVLAGWDLGATPEEVASWRQDRRPFPTDTVVVATGVALGAAVGLLPREHRPRWVILGALGGATAAGASRRLWELRP